MHTATSKTVLEAKTVRSAATSFETDLAMERLSRLMGGDMAQPIRDEPRSDDLDFSQATEAYRAEIRLHCYRMLGSLQDAEDVTQEALLRAWQHRDAFAGRSSLRAWLYKIATNACLDLLRRRPRRLLPVWSHPEADPAQPPAPPVVDPVWLEPFPDELLAGVTPPLEAQVGLRESVRLAFLVALQALPPRQRAVLILSDVLDWQAAETAELLETSLAAVSSALHRARATLSRYYHASGADEARPSAADDEVQSLLDRYVQAWEASDIAALVALLKEDATFTMPPSPTWYRGVEAIGSFLAAVVLAAQNRGEWRLVLTSANAQPAIALYRWDPDSGRYQAYAVQILTLDGGRIADVTTFLDPALPARFGLPAEVDG
jgi:RNA polymerase sigma-70 factor (ECF subfamily)